jgi:hypothetical protein
VDHGWGLGPFDAVVVRLRAAHTIIFLDFSLVQCACRAIPRSRERDNFWLLRYPAKAVRFSWKRSLTMHLTRLSTYYVTLMQLRDSSQT